MIITYTTFDGEEFNTEWDDYAERNAMEHEVKELNKLSAIAQKEIEADFDREEIFNCLGNVPNRVICTYDNYLYLSAFENFRGPEDSTIELGTWDDIKDEPFSYIVFTKLSDKLEEYEEE